MISRLSCIPTVLEFQYRDQITRKNYIKTSALLKYIGMFEIGNPDLRVYIDFPRSGCRIDSSGIVDTAPITDGRYILFTSHLAGETQDHLQLVPDVTVTTDEGSYTANILMLETEKRAVRVVYPQVQRNGLLESALREDASVGAVLSPDGGILAHTGFSLSEAGTPPGCDGTPHARGGQEL